MHAVEGLRGMLLEMQGRGEEEQAEQKKEAVFI